MCLVTAFQRAQGPFSEEISSIFGDCALFPHGSVYLNTLYQGEFEVAEKTSQTCN